MNIPGQGRQIAFEDLKLSDLIIDAVYSGGGARNISDDPLSRLLGCGNQGGFRPVRQLHQPRHETRYAYVCLYSSSNDLDWPDTLELSTGTFTYYGDNKSFGHGLHDTAKGGNSLLRASFASLHAVPPQRDTVPPFLVFTRGGQQRDVVFRGLAAPGGPAVGQSEDLVAIWKARDGQRFQNYRATFTILDAGGLARGWLDDLKTGNGLGGYCPAAWREWVEAGIYRPLRAAPTTRVRSKEQQLPTDANGRAILKRIYDQFPNPYHFEHCAAAIVQMMDPNIVSCDLTRPWRDGGRDAIGQYRIGPDGSDVRVEFALEAKRYAPGHGVGIKDTSRLISRLRYRQFGIFVTTSYISNQAYQEIIDDDHPVVVLSGGDIVRILVEHGFASPALVQEWLDRMPAI